MIKVEIKKVKPAEIEIKGEIEATEFESFREKVLAAKRKEVELPGFRKGHAPDALIVGKIGAEKILYEMAEEAISHHYPKIISDNKIDAIGRPEITITKIADNNPLGFTITTAIVPEVKLGNYKKVAKTILAKKEESIETSDEEINQVIEEIRKSRAKKDGEKEELPELNDDFAKSLGQFVSVDDLKQKIKENISLDKTQKNKEKRRLEIMEGIITDTEISLPQILIENEQDKMAYEMRTQLEKMGLKYEDYLSHLKKSEEDLKKEWQTEAEKRVKFGLILEEIAKIEKITANQEKLDHEVAHLLEHYPQADPERLRSYAEGILVNEEVFSFLDQQK